MTSIAEATRRLVDSDPCIIDAMIKGYVNYTELARRLLPLVESMSSKKASLDAIKMALVRYAEKLSRKEDTRFPILSILAQSALELRTNIVVATLHLSALPKLFKRMGELMAKARFLNIMQGLRTFTIIVDEEHFSLIEQAVDKEDFVDVIRDQSAVIIVSPKEIITTPGFVAYITGLLARHNINITQVESCHTDTVLILDRSSALKAFEVLEEAIKLAKRVAQRGYQLVEPLASEA